MNRRQLLSAGLSAATVTAASALNFGAEKLKPLKDPLDARMEALEQRFDKLEHHHKNLIRVGGLAFALSTGIDLAIFL
jgi:hypothetical protein